jgi:hypothetical protein
MASGNYPVYIVSKGRFKNPITARYFIDYGLTFYVVVEPQEFDAYADSVGAHRVLKLPFSNLGLGSYPARNFAWSHSIANGYRKHWIFDDNIQGFAKWIDGKKKYINEGAHPLAYVEAFAEQHGIDIAGFEYRYFVARPPKRAFKVNCHVYSAMLINNDLPYRWRLKYNEDVDLCLQVLHNGGKTASCVYYMTNKISTAAKMKGGNQDELYKGNAPAKKLLKAKTLEAVWPQYAKTIIRFNRIHHHVDWRIFQKRLLHVKQTPQNATT